MKKKDIIRAKTPTSFQISTKIALQIDLVLNDVLSLNFDICFHFQDVKFQKFETKPT